MMARSQLWLALVIGNSRLHWGAFAGDRWLGDWHTPHLSPEQGEELVKTHFATATWPRLGLVTPVLEIGAEDSPLDLWVASVVQTQSAVLTNYHGLHRVETAQVPLAHTYPSLGVDRALTLVGAGATYGWPVLVVDCGTALTLTTGDRHHLTGGAILPGLAMQFRALHEYTDGLPLVQLAPEGNPPRWAMTTTEALLSGVIYTQLAGIRDFLVDWWARCPGGQVVFTGGDSDVLYPRLLSCHPELTHRLRVDPNLMFWGLRVCRQQTVTAP